MRTYETLTVITPVFNERTTVAEIIRRMRAVELPLTLQIIVVDDGSSDGSDKVLGALEDSTVRVLRHKVNQGKAAAIRTGLAEARGDLVLIQDADLEYDPNDWPLLLEPILRGKARVVYGSRFTGQRKNMLPLHWMGNRLLSLVTNVLYSSTLSDMETCYKLFDAEVLEGITIVSNRFDFEPEITAKVLRRGHRIYEVPISYAGREPDEGKKITWRDGYRRAQGAGAVPLHQGVLRPLVSTPIGAVVVDHDAGPLLEGCVRSVLGGGATAVVVVENGAAGSAGGALASSSTRQPAPPVRIVRPGRNLGFGAGVNRGLAALAGESSPPNGCSSPTRTSSSTPARCRPCTPSWSPTRRGRSWGRGSSPTAVRSTRRCAISLHLPTPPGMRCWRCSTPRTPSRGATTRELPTATSSPRRDGSRAPASSPAAAPWKSSVASTSRTSCTSRTWTCAGAPTRPGGVWASPAPPR